MVAAGVIRSYAVFGAIAQMRHTAPVGAFDVDVLVDVPESDRPDLLSPLHDYCRSEGFEVEGEAIRVGAWPLQFIPVFNTLTREATAHAEIADWEGVPLRVVRADYLAVIALEAGRPKDMARILALLESGSVTRGALAQLAGRHGLEDAWQRLQTRFLDG